VLLGKGPEQTLLDLAWRLASGEAASLYGLGGNQDKATGA
jgi:hypothetical protein